MKQMVVLGSIIFFAAALLWFNLRMGFNEAQQDSQASPEDDIRSSLQDPMADTDGDGLANWEEELYGTSKRNTDSDGDGISDGMEQLQGSDPGVGYVYQLDDVGEVISINEPVQSYSFSKQQSPKNPQEMLQQLSQVSYSIENLNGNIPDTQHVASKQVLNAIAVAILNNVTSTTQNNQSLQAYAQGKTSDTYALEQIIQGNKNIINSLLAVQNTNADLASFVQQLVSNARSSNQALEYVLENKPVDEQVRASSSQSYVPSDYIQSWQRYAQSQQEWVDIMVAMHEWVVSHGVVFTKEEAGHMFMFEL